MTLQLMLGWRTSSDPSLRSGKGGLSIIHCESRFVIRD
jgi:hypothetical protein